MENNQPVPPQPVSPAPPPPAVSQPLPQGVGRSKKPFIIVGLVILVMILLLIAGLFYMRSGSTDPTNIPTPTDVPAPTAPTTQEPSLTPSTAIEMVLDKGRKTAIPNSDVEIMYVGADTPNPNCIDCSTTTDFILEQKGNEEKLQYLCGGIAGLCTEKLSGFGLEVELVNTTETHATVRVLKK